MKNGKIAITVVFLALAIGNYFRFNFSESVRGVEFLSIFAIGMLAGVLLTQIFKVISDRK